MKQNNKKTVRIIDTISINKKLSENMYYEDISTEYDRWADNTYLNSLETIRRQNLSTF